MKLKSDLLFKKIILLSIGITNFNGIFKEVKILIWLPEYKINYNIIYHSKKIIIIKFPSFKLKYFI